MSHNDIRGRAEECVRAFSENLCPRVHEIEEDYKDNAMDSKNAMTADFSSYARQWDDVSREAENLRLSSAKVLRAMKKEHPEETDLISSLTRMEPALRKLAEYAAAARTVAKNLDRKIQGGKYGYFEYRKELKASNKARDQFAELCSADSRSTGS